MNNPTPKYQIGQKKSKCCNAETSMDSDVISLESRELAVFNACSQCSQPCDIQCPSDQTEEQKERVANSIDLENGMIRRINIIRGTMENYQKEIEEFVQYVFRLIQAAKQEGYKKGCAEQREKDMALTDSCKKEIPRNVMSATAVRIMQSSYDFNKWLATAKEKILNQKN